MVYAFMAHVKKTERMVYAFLAEVRNREDGVRIYGDCIYGVA
jgi:hypothetical protein